MGTKNKRKEKQTEGSGRKRGGSFTDEPGLVKSRKSKKDRGFRRGVFSEDDLEIDPWDFDPELEELNFE